MLLVTNLNLNGCSMIILTDMHKNAYFRLEFDYSNLGLHSNAYILSKFNITFANYCRSEVTKQTEFI